MSQFVLSPLTSSAAGTTSSDPVSSNTSSGSLLNSLTSTLSTSQSSPLSPGLINSITSQLTTQLSAKETGNSSKEDTCDCEHCTQLLRGEEQVNRTGGGQEEQIDITGVFREEQIDIAGGVQGRADRYSRRCSGKSR